MNTRLATWLAQLTSHQSAMLRLNLSESIAALVKRGLTLLLLLIVAGLIDILPGVDKLSLGRLNVAEVLKLGVALAALALLPAIFQRGVRLLGEVARVIFHLPAEATEHDAPVARLAWGVALLLLVGVGYWLVNTACVPLIQKFIHHGWPLTVINGITVLSLLAALIEIFRGSSPLFGHVGDIVARRVAPPPPPPEMNPVAEADAPRQDKCPACGVLYESGSRYCAFCGHALTPPPPAPTADNPTP